MTTQMPTPHSSMNKTMTAGRTLTSTVTLGKAAIYTEGLRCLQDLTKAGHPVCNHLIARFNSHHQIAGVFRCPKAQCKQDIEVSLTMAA